MTDPGPSFLDVPGARLYYERYGSGPLLIMVPGAAGCTEPYRMIASQLASGHTVVAYDRRGFSRSTLVGEQDYERRLDSDADDLAALIDHLGDGSSAIAFGNSSGAIVVLQVLTRHPEAIATVIAHEPPTVMELPDGQTWVEFFASLYELYHSSGPDPAMDQFRERAFVQTDAELMARVPTNEYSAANSAYWFEHELRQYPATLLDHESLRQHVDQLVLAVGQASQGSLCHETTTALGRVLGRQPVTVPGGHLGFIADPAGAASALERYLRSPGVTPDL